MRKFLNKLKNNKGEAEPIFFVLGVLIVLVVLFFSFDVFKLTWQRYIVKKDVLSISRLYATRWVEVYKKPDCDGTWEQCSYPMISQSKLVKDIEDMMEALVDEGNLTGATLTISKTNSSTCGGANTLLCIKASGTSSTSTGKNWSSLKDLDYGTTLYATLDVSYEWKTTLWLPPKNESYKVYNKFASERFRNDSDIVGS